MNRWLKRIMAALTVAGVIAILVAGRVVHDLRQPLELDEPVIIEVTPGMSLRQLGNRMADRDLLASAWLLTLPGRWNGSSRAIQAGEYRLQPGMRPADVLELLIRGRTIQHPVVLVEGWQFRDVLQDLWRNNVIDNTLEGQEETVIMEALEIAWPSPEGAFFPDTYHVTRGTSDVDLLRRAAGRLQQVLEEEWQRRAVALPYDSPYEALIMASIVEKESAHRPEMPRIAGVFMRRLQQGMRLQSDPTVIYGMGEAYDGDIRREDLTTTTPYNTYRVNGLPPTPIALAGRDAIRAALQPAEEEYLYFVSRGDGTHQFSETLEQHNAAVRRFILGEAVDPDAERDEGTP
ncbi:MAG: endolytic transglycosylase MltG [Pseudohongiellaceae bacterium]